LTSSQGRFGSVEKELFFSAGASADDGAGAVDVDGEVSSELFEAPASLVL